MVFTLALLKSIVNNTELGGGLEFPRKSGESVKEGAFVIDRVEVVQDRMSPKVIV